jgi:hypothetical protein
MDAFAFVYSAALMIGLVVAGAFAIGCVVMLVVAHRRGRLQHALAGAIAGINRSRRVRERASRSPRRDGVESTAAPGVFCGLNGLELDRMLEPVAEISDVNPASGLPMVGADLDIEGNLYGTTSAQE